MNTDRVTLPAAVAALRAAGREKAPSSQAHQMVTCACESGTFLDRAAAERPPRQQPTLCVELPDCLTFSCAPVCVTLPLTKRGVTVHVLILCYLCAFRVLRYFVTRIAVTIFCSAVPLVTTSSTT